MVELGEELLVLLLFLLLAPLLEVCRCRCCCRRRGQRSLGHCHSLLLLLLLLRLVTLLVSITLLFLLMLTPCPAMLDERRGIMRATDSLSAWGVVFGAGARQGGWGANDAIIIVSIIIIVLTVVVSRLGDRWRRTDDPSATSRSVLLGLSAAVE